MSFRVKWKEKNGIKVNKTTTFLLPVFGYKRSYYTKYLIDLYIFSIKDHKVAIIFENVDDPGLVEQLYRICNHHGFDESFTDDNDREVVVIMKIEKGFQADFNKFINGEYSKFSDKLKNLLMIDNKKATGGDENGPNHKVSVYDALYPMEIKARLIANYLDVAIKDVPKELLDKPNLDVELYKDVSELKSGDKG